MHDRKIIGFNGETVDNYNLEGLLPDFIQVEDEIK